MNSDSICHIVGAGDFFGMENPQKGDFVIAADGGLKYLNKIGIKSDLVIGDFDSYGNLPAGENIIALPCEKDDTDTAAAVSEGIKIGYKNFMLYGMVGGRFEHTVANLQLIASLSQKGFRAAIDAGDNIYLSLTDGKVRFSPLKSGFISVFSHSDVSEGVSIRNLKYEAVNITMKNNIALGVSNEFVGKEAQIEVKNGTLLIIYPKDTDVIYEF